MSRPASRPRVTQGSGIGSHARPTCGIWIRWSISGQAGEPGLVGRAGDAGQPGRRLLAPREAADLQDDPQPLRAAPLGALVRPRGLGCGSGSPRARLGPRPGGRSPSPRRRGRRAPRRGASSCPVSTAAGTGRSRCALRRRHSAAGVSSTTATAGKPGGPRGRPASGRGGRRRGRACRRRWSGRGRAARRRSAPAGRTRPSRRPGRAVRCRPRRAARRRRRSPRGGSAPPPRSTCRIPRARPGRPAPGPAAGSLGRCRLPGWQLGAGRGLLRRGLLRRGLRRGSGGLRGCLRGDVLGDVGRGDLRLGPGRGRPGGRSWWPTSSRDCATGADGRLGRRRRHRARHRRGLRPAEEPGPDLPDDHPSQEHRSAPPADHRLRRAPRILDRADRDCLDLAERVPVDHVTSLRWTLGRSSDSSTHVQRAGTGAWITRGRGIVSEWQRRTAPTSSCPSSRTRSPR